MSHERTMTAVRDALAAAFAGLDAWFDTPAESRGFRPAAGGWTAGEVLDHVALTNHFLLLTLTKWAAVAERRANRGDPVPAGESDLARLDVIGERGSFAWPRPAHMEPAGRPADEVRAVLAAQHARCLALIARLPGGVGALCRVTMTVNDLGKIDLYQWLYFLAQHARRHLQQLAAIRNEAEARR